MSQRFHSGFAPSTSTQTASSVQDPHAAALATIARGFAGRQSLRLDEAEEALSYETAHDLIFRGYLRVELTGGEANLVHVVDPPPDLRARAVRIAMSPGVSV